MTDGAKVGPSHLLMPPVGAKIRTNSHKFLQKLQIRATRGAHPTTPRSKFVQNYINSNIMLQNRTNSYQIRAKSHKFAQIHAKLVNYKYQGVRAPESRRPKAYKIVQIRTLRRKIVEIRAKIVQNLTNWCKFLQIHTKIANQSYKGCAPQKHGVQNFVRFYKFAHNGAKSCEFVPKSYKITQIC